MNAPGQKDKFTPELRILVASLLSFGVIILWARFFGPKPQIPPTQPNRPAQTAPATPGPATSPASTPSPTTATPAKIAPATTASIVVKNDSQERSVVVENNLYRVEISNRGAVVKSWQLKGYMDDAKPQRVLDVVHPEASQQTGDWPFAVVLDDEQLQNAANGGLYRAWVSEPGPAAETHGHDYSILPANPIKAPSGKDFVGIEDRYFTAAFLPPIIGRGDAVPVPMGALETRYWKASRTVKVNGQDTLEPVPQVAAAAAATQPLALRVYVGPKDYDDLKKMNPPLHGLINFGWLEFIAEPLFHGLKWLHTYIPNWGWAIVVLTLVINMLLFPLRISSYKTTLKMQRVAPEIKAIQEKYKKYSMRDPRKAEMNKEVMAIYSREGINPVGGCFQMFLQMPVWFGLNTALRYAIEMRHAAWLWVSDLSAKDPYYILPVLMGLSMYLVSKMTPMTATDPQQQAMMKIMPITMAGIFMISPISSGLAVYILTSSVVGIAQQWYLNRAHPVPAPAKPVRGKKS